MPPFLPCLLLVVATSCHVAAGGADVPKVVSPQGVFVGRPLTSGRQQRTFYAFTGVPYAMPPVHDLRFRFPFPTAPMVGEYDATRPSPECLQWDHLRMRGIVGEEDCLYLDVYTNAYPALGRSISQQPVVVFIHAGSWLAGGGALDLFTPDYLIENDVVVVTVNHRLGALGFLSTEDTHGPGNYGVRDVVRALEWVRDNIWHFGGMNDSVTVMGAGAGGSTAHLLTLTPLARGAALHFDTHSLLARAISQSGTAYTPHAISRDARSQALRLAATVGCPPEVESEDLMRCLRQVKGNVLVGQTPTLFKWDEEPLPFAPVVDEWMGDAAFLPEEPHRLIHQRQVLRVPWIAGTNREDGSFRVQDILKDPHLVKELNTDWDRVGPVLLHITKTSCKDPVAISKQIRDYYLKGHEFGEATARQFVEMMTDRFFVYPTDTALTDHCRAIEGSTSIFCYRYVLDYCGRKSFLDILHQETEAVRSSPYGPAANPRFQNTRGAHGWGVGFLDELLYLFPSPRLQLVYRQTMDEDGAARVSNNMIMFWTNFIKGGDPTPLIDGYPDDISPWGAWWEPYYIGYDFYLKIDPDMNTQETPYRTEQKQFWSSLPLFENREHNVLKDEL